MSKRLSKEAAERLVDALTRAIKREASEVIMDELDGYPLTVENTALVNAALVVTLLTMAVKVAKNTGVGPEKFMMTITEIMEAYGMLPDFFYQAQRALKAEMQAMMQELDEEKSSLPPEDLN